MKSRVKQFVKEFGDYYLSQITISEFEKFQSRMLENGLAKSTVNLYIVTLKHMFHKARNWDMISEDHVSKLARVKCLKVETPPVRHLSKEESIKLIDGCDDLFRPIVILALNTGMRKEEILSLRWEENIDLDKRVICLTKTKNRKGRNIPMNDIVADTLENLPQSSESPYFFNKSTGKTRLKEIQYRFSKALKAAGIKDFTFHGLRHTFASHMIMGGADLVTVSEILGHSSITMTMRYAHLSAEHKVKAVNDYGQKMGLNGSGQKLYNSVNREVSVPMEMYWFING